jgi:hypothetical protein
VIHLRGGDFFAVDFQYAGPALAEHRLESSFMPDGVASTVGTGTNDQAERYRCYDSTASLWSGRLSSSFPTFFPRR